MMSKTKILTVGLQTLLLLALTACQTHEFTQLGISKDQRDADSLKCLREGREAYDAKQKPGSAASTSNEIIVGGAIKGYGSGRAMGEYHKECMTKLGYKSVKLD